MYAGYQTYGPNNFNFKDMSMFNAKPTQKDYFSLRPVRGSSPTSSLTADLDANFHIDKRYSTFLATGSRSCMLTIVPVLKLRLRGDLCSPPSSSSLVMKLVSACHQANG
jgi:hypothetical protein